MSALDMVTKAVESNEFSAFVNVASGFSSFLRGLESQPEVLQLREAIRHPDSRNAILTRILELTEQEVDPEGEHPWDAALAAYLYAVGREAPELSKTLAEKVLVLPRTWWARKIAERLLLECDERANGTLPAPGGEKAQCPR